MSIFFLKNWYVGICTYLIYTFWWVWSYAYTCDIISTMKVLNVSITSKNFFVFCVCLWQEKLTWGLSSTYLKMHNIILLTLGTMLYSRQVSDTHSPCITETLYPLSSNGSSPCPPTCLLSYFLNISMPWQYGYKKPTLGRKIM